jgi:hypothetical protein
MNIRLFASVLVRSAQDAELFLGTGYVFDILYSAFQQKILFYRELIL